MTTPWQTAPWTPWTWQREALDAWASSRPDSAPVIRAVTGAGKSIAIAEVCHLQPGRVVLLTPTVKLVEQLSETLKVRGLKVGRYYTKTKQTTQRVVVCCNDSLASLARRIDPPALLICDEAHKTENDQVLDVVLGKKDDEGQRSDGWAPGRVLGFTATPYRADNSEALSLFDELLYDYGPAQAIKDGVVVRPRVVQYEGGMRTIDDACIEMILAAEGPGIVDAINITDAEEFAESLRDAGLRAKSVHSKLHDSTVAHRLAQLERADLDVIVHVQLLSEGVDLPWLRWLCCRRPIGSKVLFAQYIGRGLRRNGPMQWGGVTLPEKKWCWIFDPNDLFGKLSLDYEAVLSGDIDDEGGGIPEMPALELDWIIDELNDTDEPPDTLRDVPLKVIDPAVAYVRRLHLAFQWMGLASMKIGDAEWRREAPTERQLSRLSKDAWVVNEPDVPATHRRALIIAIRAAKGLDRGTVSDLIACLKVLAYGWPNEVEQEVAA